MHKPTLGEALEAAQLGTARAVGENLTELHAALRILEKSSDPDRQRAIEGIHEILDAEKKWRAASRRFIDENM